MCSVPSCGARCQRAAGRVRAFADLHRKRADKVLESPPDTRQARMLTGPAFPTVASTVRIRSGSSCVHPRPLPVAPPAPWLRHFVRQFNLVLRLERPPTPRAAASLAHTRTHLRLPVHPSAPCLLRCQIDARLLLLAAQARTSLGKQRSLRTRSDPVLHPQPNTTSESRVLGLLSPLSYTGPPPSHPDSHSRLRAPEY